MELYRFDKNTRLFLFGVMGLTFENPGRLYYTYNQSQQLCGADGKEGDGIVENERIRISDIAQELGLSTATVSNVIHGKTKML